jgi:16S rRNA (uracil1498-N3)-methyltransferase
MRRRFFVEKFEGGSAKLEGEAAHHLGRVLRAETGQVYELSDGHSAWLAKVDRVGRDKLEFVLLEQIPSHTTSLEIILLLSVVKFDAMEWALEKATELGISRIMPLAASRSEKALIAAAAKRGGRWKKILLGASEQSRRLGVPVLHEVARPEKAFCAIAAEIKLMLSERPEAPPLRGVLEGASGRRVALAIGPEGGWTDEEFGAASRAGFRQASLGPLVLRTETAVIAALASVNYALAQKDKSI